jgi:hypothetical protein
VPTFKKYILKKNLRKNHDKFFFCKNEMTFWAHGLTNVQPTINKKKKVKKKLNLDHQNQTNHGFLNS